MATQQINLPLGVATAANNAAWVLAISQALTALGIPIDSGVTGQINPGSGSIALPGTSAGTTTLGFETRSFVSAGLTTIYMNVYYCLFAAAASPSSWAPCVILTFGTTVSSTGVLSGRSTEYPAGPQSVSGQSGFILVSPNVASNPSTGTTYALYMSSDGAGYLTAAGDPQNLTGLGVRMCGFFERTRSISTGAYSDDGLYINTWGNVSAVRGAFSPIYNGQSSGNPEGQNLDFRYGTTRSQRISSGLYLLGLQIDSIFTALSPPTSTATPWIYPISHSLPGGSPNAPLLSAVSAFSADMVGGAELITGTLYGASHTFLYPGSNCPNESSSIATLLRYE